MENLAGMLDAMPSGRAAALMYACREGWTHQMVGTELGWTRERVLAELRAGLVGLRPLLPTSPAIPA